MPTAVTMPWTVAHPAAPGGKAPGQHGGWLGKGFDPFKVEGDPNARGFQVGGLGLPEGVDATRLGGRRALLNGLAGGMDLPGAGALAWDGFQHRALDALDSAREPRAFQISTAKTPSSATDTADTSTASASCWPDDWSRRVSAW